MQSMQDDNENVTESATHQSVHVKLATACSCIAASSVHDPGWDLLGDIGELGLQLLCLQEATAD